MLHVAQLTNNMNKQDDTSIYNKRCQIIQSFKKLFQQLHVKIYDLIQSLSKKDKGTCTLYYYNHKWKVPSETLMYHKKDSLYWQLDTKADYKSFHCLYSGSFPQ